MGYCIGSIGLGVENTISRASKDPIMAIYGFNWHQSRHDRGRVNFLKLFIEHSKWDFLRLCPSKVLSPHHHSHHHVDHHHHLHDAGGSVVAAVAKEHTQWCSHLPKYHKNNDDDEDDYDDNNGMMIMTV